MTTSSSRVLFARLGPVRAVDRVASGFPATLVLRRPDGPRRPVRPIDAVLALVTRHAAAAAAKRAVEVAMADGEGVIEVPAIESAAALDDELSRAGFRVSRVREAPSALDVRALRARMALSSAAFARRYGFNTRTVEGWEQGRPIDTASAILLQVIATDPSAVARVMETPLTDRHDAS